MRILLGNIKIVSKLMNASFPDYESVIPKDNDQQWLLIARVLAKQ